MFIGWFLSFSQGLVVLMVGSMYVVHRDYRHEDGDNGEICENRADGSLWTWSW